MTEQYKFAVAMFRTSAQSQESYNVTLSFIENKAERQRFQSIVTRHDNGTYFIK